MIATQPKSMTICQLEVLLMPNGELICLGRTVGWFEGLKECLSLPEAKDPIGTPATESEATP